MDVEYRADAEASLIAAAIGAPSRSRILYCLVDGQARTSTELSVVAEVSPSTASVHLKRLAKAHLVKLLVHGKHRSYRLAGPDVASALEALSVLAGGSRSKFVLKPFSRLRVARTCYDHMAGIVAVSIHDRFKSLGWLSDSRSTENAYDLAPNGVKACETLGIDIEATRTLRRKFAYPCLDWSERRPHIGGALGAALLNAALKKKWVLPDLDSRALEVTKTGRHEIFTRFGLQVSRNSSST
jgi:DNA-binding transcriptional ArsR family regulator